MVLVNFLKLQYVYFRDVDLKREFIICMYERVVVLLDYDSLTRHNLLGEEEIKYRVI